MLLTKCVYYINNFLSQCIFEYIGYHIIKQLSLLCFTRKKYTDKSWSHIYNKYLLSVIKRMKKFENKQKVVFEWRKLLELWAEYIHKFMFHFFSFLSVISEIRNYNLRLLSPPVRVAQKHVVLLLTISRFYDKAMNFYMRNILRIMFHHRPKDSFEYSRNKSI